MKSMVLLEIAGIVMEPVRDKTGDFPGWGRSSITIGYETMESVTKFHDLEKYIE